MSPWQACGAKNTHVHENTMLICICFLPRVPAPATVHYARSIAINKTNGRELHFRWHMIGWSLKGKHKGYCGSFSHLSCCWICTTWFGKRALRNPVTSALNQDAPRHYKSVELLTPELYSTRAFKGHAPLPLLLGRCWSMELHRGQAAGRRSPTACITCGTTEAEP